MPTSRSHIKHLIEFLEKSPTAWHAVENVAEQLALQGFEPLSEQADWELTPGKGYYVTRNGSSFIGFIVPLAQPARAHVCASHTDSPALKLKPNPAFRKENMLMLGVDVYGAPLLSSWLNRDLGIAGRIVHSDRKGNIREKLVCVTDQPLVIPQLAIHLDREVNMQGLVLNKQEHLSALAGIHAVDEKSAKNYLSDLLGVDHILSTDLFLFPLEKPSLAGLNQDILSSYRLDSLASVHAISTAISHKPKPHGNILKMCVFWDNEEIGSETAHGAASPFFAETLERILLSLGYDRQTYLRLLASSICLSVDLAHALHPNYMEKHEPRHQTPLGSGVIIKHSTQQRYASDARTAGYAASLCLQNKIPFKHMINRADIPSGTTIGPIHANNTGMPTVDIGIPQLSMHSARELIACVDQIAMIDMLTAFYA